MEQAKCFFTGKFPCVKHYWHMIKPSLTQFHVEASSESFSFSDFNAAANLHVKIRPRPRSISDVRKPQNRLDYSQLIMTNQIHPKGSVILS